ncbi:hypothetical protein D9757_009229 [Collybiopsis confluens]|uniref:Uncharacterized protein n=1 Tax=Collybiopsis confluens TaxID=2823264 RepID=A0A8H5HA98_9AGAR|nr:hypothetical protein D9757_009229 [Collybiopsis confluens]
MDNSRAADSTDREHFAHETPSPVSLLAAPAERDVRIIDVVNRVYATATSATNLYSRQTPCSDSSFLAQGTRHLQRILDALPTDQIPKPRATSQDSDTSPV